MKAKYDFSKGKRGAVIPSPGNKVRITIRLDRDIIDWFRSKVEEQGGGNYQTMLNDALRSYMEHHEQPLEEVIRRVVREELQLLNSRNGIPLPAPDRCSAILRHGR